MSGFVTVPCVLAGKFPMMLTIFVEHVLLRWQERGSMSFASPEECARYTVTFFMDERLSMLAQHVKRGACIAMVDESANLVFFFKYGTAYDEKEIKVMTIYPYIPGNKVLVEETDLCYILPKEGKLRFGRERKYFELKKRRP